MAGTSSLRASDADRDRVADRLRRAATEGRLLTEELEQRLEAAFRARTYGQLEALIADLPGKRLLPRRRRRRVHWIPAVLAIAIALPIVLAAVAVIVQLAIGVVAAWWIWLAAGWFFFGRHRRHGPPWPGPRRRAWHEQRLGAQRSWSNWA